MRLRVVCLSVAFSLAACGGRSREAESRDGKAGQAATSAPGDACAAGKEKYLKQRQQLLTEISAGGCKVDADCGVLWENNACVNTCGVNVPVTSAEAAREALADIASANCNACPPIPTPPCAPPAPVVCKQGQCSEG